MSDADKDKYRQEIRAADTTALRDAIEAMQRQYDEVNSNLESARTRAGGLLTATGVIAGVVALAATFTVMSHSESWLGLGGLLLAGIVVYCAVATTFLAIRAQQVDFWGQAVLHPSALSNEKSFQESYSAALYIIWRENLERLKLPVGYLRDAQVYFRVLVIALGLLVVLTVLSGLSGTVGTGATGPATHAASASHSP